MMLLGAVIFGLLVGFAILFAVHAVQNPAATDLTGVLSASQTIQGHLGCPYTPAGLQAGFSRLNVGSTLVASRPFAFNEPSAIPLAASPFALMPLSVAAGVFAAVSLAALAAAWRLLAGRIRATLPNLGLVVGAALLMNIPADDGLGLLQTEPLLLLVASLAILALSRGHDRAGGVLLGLLTVKPQLVWPALLVLLLTRRRSALVGAGVTAIVVYGVSFATLPAGCAATWLSSATASSQLFGIGLPSVVAATTGSRLLALCTELVGVFAVGLLLRSLYVRGNDVAALLSVGFASAIVVSLHAPTYDLLFFAPLGAELCRRFPQTSWVLVLFGVAVSVARLADVAFGGGWVVTMTQVVALLGFLAALVMIGRAREAEQ
jgi:Glycosyltransferase family 87